MTKLEMSRLKKLEVRRDSEEYWEVAAEEMPESCSLEEGGNFERIAICVCVSSLGEVTIAEPQIAKKFARDAGLQAIAKLALGAESVEAPGMNYLPPRVIVGALPEHAHRALIETLTPLGVIVESKGETPLASAYLLGFAEHIEEGFAEGSPSTDVAGLMSVKGVTIERVRAFAEAGKMCWEAAPWKRFQLEAVWRIEPAPKSAELRHCTVMGGGGEVFGLAFIADAKQMADMASGESPKKILAQGRRTYWSIIFNDAEFLPEADEILWQEHRLPLASRGAYPVPTGVSAENGVERPSAEQLSLMEGLLRAFASVTKAEIMCGRISRKVKTFDGELDIQLIDVDGDR